jgi:hypothetical protein
MADTEISEILRPTALEAAREEAPNPHQGADLDELPDDFWSPISAEQRAALDALWS